jgi:hypothetical protein
MAASVCAREDFNYEVFWGEAKERRSFEDRHYGE